MIRILWVHRIRKICWNFWMFSKDHSGFLQFHKRIQTKGWRSGLWEVISFVAALEWASEGCFLKLTFCVKDASSCTSQLLYFFVASHKENAMDPGPERFANRRRPVSFVKASSAASSSAATDKRAELFHFLARRWVICPFRSAFFFFRFYVRGRHRQSAVLKQQSLSLAQWRGVCQEEHRILSN